MNSRVSPPLYFPPPVHALGPSVPEQYADNRKPGAGGKNTVNGLPLIQGPSEVSMYVAEHGFYHGHVQELARFATERNIVIALDATNICCAEHARNVLPVVPPGLECQAVHQFGPLSGFVPRTRIDLRGDARERSDRLVTRYLEEQRVTATNLVISRRAIDDLMRQGALVEEKRRAQGTSDTSWLICQREERTYTFIAASLHQAIKGYGISYEGKPIQVLGKNYGGYVAPYSGGQYRLLALGKNRSRLGRSAVSEHLHSQLSDINLALGRTPDNPIVTSRDNSKLPFPCLFFGPGNSGVDGAAYARDEETVNHLQQKFREAGYPLPVAPEPLAGGNRGRGVRTALIRQYWRQSDTERSMDASDSEASRVSPVKSADSDNARSAPAARPSLSVSELLRNRSPSSKERANENEAETPGTIDVRPS